MNLEEIGLWSDAETGYYVDVNSLHEYTSDSISYGALFIDPSGRWALTEGWVGGKDGQDIAVCTTHLGTTTRRGVGDYPGRRNRARIFSPSKGEHILRFHGVDCEYLPSQTSAAYSQQQENT